MIRSLFFGVALFALLIASCKSGNKEEVASETAADTTMVSTSAGSITVDSAALAAEEVEIQKNTAAKATQPEKTSAATKKSTGTPAAKPSETADKAAEMEADKGYVEFPSKRATYPGGQTALNKYLADNMKYPPQAREENIEGTVYASILVDEQGNIVEVSFPKPLGYGLEEEVSRVIKGMPKLIPAEDQSKPVKTKYVLPVKFKLN